MPFDEPEQKTLASNPAPGPSTSSGLLAFAAISDRGRSRSTNQDYAYAGPLPGAPEWKLLAVADGLGGHARGEWASQRTIELLVSSLGAAIAGASDDVAAALRATIAVVNRTIHAEANSMNSPGAATTLVAAVARGRQVWWSNVGDSRLYRWSGGTLSQVSTDHSWVADQVHSGRLPASAMHDHPEKNVVTRTIGFETEVSPDVGGPLFIVDSETILLCSDGLHGPVSEPDMSRCLGELSPSFAAERLVELANEAGGPDNVTVVVGHFGGASTPPATTQLTEPEVRGTHRKKRRIRRWWISGAAAVLTGAFAAVPLAVVRFL